MINSMLFSILTVVTFSTHSLNADSVRLVAGSCIWQRSETQPLWDYMVNNSPDAILFLGDNVYLDEEVTEECEEIDPEGLACFTGVGTEDIVRYNTYTKIIGEYDELLNRDDFLSLRESDITPLVIWDDHDYGLNNEDKDFVYKNLTRDGLLYFWNILNTYPMSSNVSNMSAVPSDVTKNSQVDSILEELALDRPNTGVYWYYDLTKTLSNNQNFNVRIYGLDPRWDKDISNSDNGTILGDEQKEWLYKVSSVTNNSDPIDFNIFLVGTNMLTRLNIVIDGFERWTQPDRQWFYDFLQNQGIADRSLLFSGDVHYSIINKRELNVDNDDTVDLFEIVTSSMTHALGKLGGASVKIVIDDDYTQTDIVHDNNFLMFDVNETGWNVSYIGFKTKNGETTENLIMTASYNFDSREFKSKTIDDGSTSDKNDALLLIILGIVGAVLLICCIGGLLWWCCKYKCNDDDKKDNKGKGTNNGGAELYKARV